jgi:hypothetical protein
MCRVEKVGRVLTYRAQRSREGFTDGGFYPTSPPMTTIECAHALGGLLHVTAESRTHRRQDLSREVPPVA